MKTITIIILITLLSACSDASEHNTVGRFDIIDKFYVFDGDRYERGWILKDRETGKCYLWIKEYGNSGGPSMTGIECIDKAEEIPHVGLD